MKTRKEMKKNAWQIVKKHYILLLAVCMLASFVGAEFTMNFMPSIYRERATAAVDSALEGKTEEGEEIAKETKTEMESGTDETSKESKYLGRSRGVFARLVNDLDSGSLFVSIILTARSIGLSRDAVIALFAIGAMLLNFLVWFYFVNVYKVVSRRIFLESCTYEKVSARKLLFLMRVKRLTKASVTMFMTYIFQTLWDFTVIGGIVKRYSYYMVAYIAAENPDLGWKETIDLSRRMMNGHKWQCFVYELSFLPWHLLGMLTAGMTDVFFTESYKLAFFTQYYGELRKLAIKNGIKGCEGFNDVYLFEHANLETLQTAYADVVELENMPEHEVPLTGVRAFLAKVFGITVFNRKDEELYVADEERKMKIDSMWAMIRGEEYPARLFTIPESEKNHRLDYLHYLRRYSITSLILLFFAFSFVGWLWEGSLHLLSDGVLVNRGVLHGPWLPIYGSGGVLILVLLNKFRKNPAVEFIAIVIVCGMIEYGTSYVLEMTHNGQRWWDYTGYFLNLDGRICAEGLLVFGVGGMAFVYIAAPLMDNLFRKISYRTAVPLCAALLIIFVADEIYSAKNPNAGEGITSYAWYLPGEKQQRGEMKV